MSLHFECLGKELSGQISPVLFLSLTVTISAIAAKQTVSGGAANKCTFIGPRCKTSSYLPAL